MRCEWPTMSRCCFCLPLRRGVLVLGYFNIAVSLGAVVVYSWLLAAGRGGVLLYHGLAADLPEELALAVYCLELAFSVALVAGAHKGSARLLRSYFHFALASTAAVLLLQLLELARLDAPPELVELLAIAFAGICIQLYTMTLVRNLLGRLEARAEFANQLHPLDAAKDAA